MSIRSSLKRSKHQLKRIVEEVVAEECELGSRGLALFVDELETVGRPPERIRAWATLHFLPLGSPFNGEEPQCHLGLWGKGRRARVEDGVRRRLHLEQPVAVEFVAVGAAVADGVEFDGPFTHPRIDWADVDHRDMLGRTALMRAAARGDEYLTERLLAGGADPTAVDRRGRSILEQARDGWIVTMLEEAIAARSRRSDGPTRS
jgi:hypothetical protein